MTKAKVSALDATGAELAEPLEIELFTVDDKLVNIQQATFKITRSGGLNRLRVKLNGDSIDLEIGETVALSPDVGLTIVPHAIAIPRSDTPIA